MTAPDAAVDERAPLSGRQLGDFVLRELLGEGGFGAVYRADQPVLGREVVVKVLKARRTAEPALASRFLREAQLASRLDHPFAAHVYAFGAEPDGVLWIAMELVRGTSLAALIEAQGAIPLDRFAPLLERICDVVHAAHERGIVHRDLKPANVMVLARAGRLLPKLLDFGIAKAHEEGEIGTADEPASSEAESRMTRAGAVLGSPPYMAPELWLRAADADARADVYALGALTFEALTGRLPFEGGTVSEIARGHARAAVPSLPAGFPPELDAVLARAMAKRPEDRYQTALEMAAAFEVAAGTAGDGSTLPQLDESLRDAFILGAPQPLAETVAALEGARNVHQAVEALWDVVHAAIRWIGVVALACRTRAAPSGDADPAELAELLVRLGKGRLDQRAWTELARALTAPFQAHREACPIPELVPLCHGPAAAALDRLLTLRTQVESGAGRSEDQRRELYAQGLRDLGELLSELAALDAYVVVVPRAGRSERWSGLRRSPRTLMIRRSRVLTDGHPVLVDRGGRPVVSLWPMVQVAPPAPGQDEELFFFDGCAPHGGRLLAIPRGFEHHDDELRTWFREHFFAAAEGGAPPSTLERAPYRGLEAFRPEDAAAFFGREREVDALLNRLRVAPLVVVVGPSGVGKSSFVQAGVIPALPADWRALTVRPGPAPLAALQARLAREGVAVSDLELAADPSSLGAHVRAVAERDATTMVVVVDQLEEMFTQCRDPVEQARYATAIASLARSAEDRVRVVITLRDDFLVRAEELPALRDRLAQGMKVLTTPLADDLRRILVEPARLAGYGFDSRELPTRIITEVAGQPGALALISFTADQLWRRRDRHFKQLTRAAYEEVGGVGGALARHAEEVMTELSPEEARLVREAFRHLVTSEGTRQVLSRIELEQLLGGGEGRAAAVIERLIAARLLNASQIDGESDRIEIIHEALVAAWPRLVTWRREDAEGARLRDELRAAARQWDARSRPRSLLWRDEALAEYRVWRSRQPGGLTEVEEAFAAASLAEGARARRARTTAIASVFALLVAGLVVVLVLNGRIARQRRGAEIERARAEAERAKAETNAHTAGERLAALYAEQGRQAMLAGDPMRGYLYLREAGDQGADDAGLRALLSRAERLLDLQLRSFDGHRGRVYTVGFSPDGGTLASSGDDGTARIWDVTTGAELRTLPAHTAPVRALAMSPDGRRLATASLDGTSAIWDRATGARVATLDAGGPALYALAYSGSGELVVTAGADGQVRTWSADSGAPVARLLGHDARVWSARFLASGDRVVTASDDATARVWDARSGRLLRVLEGHGGAVRTAEASADGARIVTSSWDRTARIWDTTSGRSLATLTGHAARVRAAEFSRDGRRVVTAGDDRTAKVWDAATGGLLISLDGHDGPLGSARFMDAAGERVVTTSGDGTARIWDARSGQQIVSLVGHLDSVIDAAISPDRTRIATASFDARVMLWDATAEDVRLVIAGHDGARAAAYFDGGARIVSVGEDATLRIWDGRTGAALDRITASQPLRAVDASPSRSEAIVSTDDAIEIWELGAKPARRARFAGAAVAAYDDAGAIVVVPQPSSVQLVDAATGTPLRTLAVGSVTCAAIRRDRGMIVLVHGNQAEIWDLVTGQRRFVLEGHTLPITACDLSPDGSRVLTASLDKTASIWDPGSGALLATLEGHTDGLTDAAFSPDGSLVATGSMDTTVSLWSVRGGQRLLSLERHAGLIASVSWSADGRALLTASGDGTSLVWQPWGDPARTTTARPCRFALRLENGRPVRATCP